MLNFLQNFAATCTPLKQGFFDFPTWYKYLPLKEDALGRCTVVNFDPKTVDNGYLLIGFAVLEIMLRVAALVSIAFIIAGGVKYITGRGDIGDSQGSPNKMAEARQTAVNALVGLVISVVSGAIVSYIAGRF